VTEVPVELGEAVEVIEAVADGGQAARQQGPDGEEGEGEEGEGRREEGGERKEGKVKRKT
jgi:hypothetical protein